MVNGKGSFMEIVLFDATVGLFVSYFLWRYTGVDKENMQRVWCTDINHTGECFVCVRVHV